MSIVHTKRICWEIWQENELESERNKEREARKKKKKKKKPPSHTLGFWTFNLLSGSNAKFDKQAPSHAQSKAV